MTPTQIAHARRGAIRWHLLSSAEVSSPQGINTLALLAIVRSVYPDATHQEIRKELNYIEERGLAEIQRDPLDNWFVQLTRDGMDVAQYTVDCDPGIDRPKITQG